MDLSERKKYGSGYAVGFFVVFEVAFSKVQRG
jgi:hypothetical protein